MTNETYEYNGGATRKATMPFYGGVPLAGLKRAAEAFDSGRYTYDETLLERNWHKGDAKFFLDTIDHAVEHLYKFLEEIQTGRIYDGDEDHLGHAIAELMMVAWATERQILPDKAVQFVPQENNLSVAPQGETKENFTYEGYVDVPFGTVGENFKLTQENLLSPKPESVNQSTESTKEEAPQKNAKAFLNTLFGKKG